MAHKNPTFDYFEIKKEFVHNELDELVLKCKASVDKINSFHEKKKNMNKQEQTDFINNLFKLFVSYNGNSYLLMQKLYRRIYNLSEEEFSDDKFYEITDNGKDRFFVKPMISKILREPADIFEEIVRLACGIVYCDGFPSSDFEHLIIEMCGLYFK